MLMCNLLSSLGRMGGPIGVEKSLCSKCSFCVIAGIGYLQESVNYPGYL